MRNLDILDWVLRRPASCSGAEAHDLWGKALGDGPVKPWKEKSGRKSATKCCVCNFLIRRHKGNRARLFLKMHSNWMREGGTFRYNLRVFLLWGCFSTGRDPETLGEKHAILGHVQDSTGHKSDKPDLISPALSRVDEWHITQIWSTWFCKSMILCHLV